MHFSLPRSLLSIFTLFAVAASGYSMAISSPDSSSEQLIFTPSPNSAFSTLVQGNPFTSLFVDYDRARQEAAAQGVFVYSQITIWTQPFPGSGYSKSFKSVSKPLPPGLPAAALLEADHMFEVQVLAKMLKAAGVVHTTQVPAFSADQITSIKDLMNGSENVRYIPMELNAFKGRIFTQVLKDIIANDGKCTVIKVDDWRYDMTRSLFAYLLDNCEEIMTTAIAVEEKIENAKVQIPIKKRWLEVSRIMETALFCMHVQVVWDENGEPEVDSCNLMS